MALIRAEHAVDYRDKSTTLNLADVAQDALKLKRDAQQQANQIIADAQAERERLIADASETGHTQGYEQGYKQGHTKGADEGKLAAEEEWHAKIMALAAAWGNALTELEQQRRSIVHSLESDALRLVADIASRVARRAVSLDHSHTAKASLDEAITRIDHATRVTIQLNPADQHATEQGMAALAERLLGSPDLKLKPNNAIAPGSVIVESDAARIDASIDLAISSLLNAILPDSTTLQMRTTAKQPEQQPEPESNASTLPQPDPTAEETP